MMNRHFRDAITLAEALTLSAAAATLVIIVATEADALLSSPSQWTWNERPFGLFVAFGVMAWILGSLPAAFSFYFRLGPIACSAIGFVYGFLLPYLPQWLGSGSGMEWKVPFAFALSGAAGGAAFALVSRALDKG